MNYIFVTILAITVIVALSRFHKAELATQIFIGILILNTITESTAIAFTRLYHNNLVVYRVSSPIELALYCLYFNYSVEKLRSIRLGWYMAGFALLTGIVSEYFFKSGKLGSLFISMEGLIIICLGFYSFYRMLLDEGSDRLFYNIHFWLGAFTSILWCSSILCLSLYDFTINHSDTNYSMYMTRIVWVSNFVSIIGFLLTFALIPKTNTLSFSFARIRGRR